MRRSDTSWSRADGSPMSREASVLNGHLIIPNIVPADAGDYICTARTTGEHEEDIARLVVLPPLNNTRSSNNY